MHSIGARSCLDAIADFAARKSDSRDEGPWRKGIGFALGTKYCAAPTAAVAKVKISEDGRIIVYHGADDVGQGCNTVAAQIAAEEFGVPVDRVKVIFEDTLVAPFFNGGSTSSRVTYQLGNAVRGACRDARKKLFDIISEKLDLPAEILETRGEVIFEKGSSEKKVSIVELFTGYKGDRPGGHGNYAGSGEIIGEHTFIQPFTPEDRDTGQIDAVAALKGLRLVSFWSYGAKAVEVAVNVETGQVRVLRSVSAMDMGRPIHPKMCEQQMDGGMGMAIGDTLFEEMVIEKGIVLNPNFTDYRVPSVMQMPLVHDVQSIFSPVSHKDGPYGAKGLGEVAFVGLQAAIANAIYDAVGVRVRSLPITPEKLLKALKKNE
jgi:CO/xanthine dehydrogenase Mo-binding subunit